METIGKKCVIRANRAGVFFGTVTSKTVTPGGYNEVELKDVRRLWYWDGAASLSQLATDGVKAPGQCKFTVVVPEMVVSGVIEIIPASDAAIRNIESVEVWKR